MPVEKPPPRIVTKYTELLLKSLITGTIGSFYQKTTFRIECSMEIRVHLWESTYKIILASELQGTKRYP